MFNFLSRIFRRIFRSPVHVIDVYDLERDRHTETIVIRDPGEADREYKRLRGRYGERGRVTLASRYVR